MYIFLDVHNNLLCHKHVIQQEGQAEYTIHGLYCYKQHDIYHAIYWYDDHAVFGMIISGMKFVPFKWHTQCKKCLFWYEIHTVVFAVFSYAPLYRCLLLILSFLTAGVHVASFPGSCTRAWERG